MVMAIDDAQSTALKAMQEQYKLGELKLHNTDGQNWKNRTEASEAYFRRYSKQWKTNLNLYSNFDKMIADYGTYVAIPFSSVQNWINDTYYRNPDPLVQDKGGDKDKSRILSDLFRSVHKECDSEGKMKEALLDQAWAGFGCVWASFRQDGIYDPDLFDYDRNAQGMVIPTKQRVTLSRVSPWRVRFDPAGRAWDLSDHNWVGILYEQTLAQIMRDPSVTDEDRRRIMTWYAGGGTSRFYNPTQSVDTVTSAFKEDDPEYIRLQFWHIWARPNKMTYRLPLGASFTLAPQPWNQEFAEADEFPLHYMAKNREPENEERSNGFIGIPDLTLIEPHVKNINKLEALFMAANQHVINKYITFKGILDTVAQQKLADGMKQFTVIELDKDALSNMPTSVLGERLSPKDILTLVPQAELKDLQHLKGIASEMEMIHQIMGQGPADRGGVSDSNTATESLGMQQGMQRRMSTARHENGKHFCSVTKKFFIILKARQTLPIRYQMTTAFNQQTWQQFSANALEDLDLHFEYAVGSSEYRTREQEFALRQQMAQVLLPIFQAQNNQRLIMKVAHDLVEPLNIIGSEQYFNDQAQALAMQLLAILRGLGKGVVMADDQRAAGQIPELVAQLAAAILTPQQLAEVEASVSGAQAPAPEGEGSLPSAPSAGESNFAAGAAGSAAAGAAGGMAN